MERAIVRSAKRKKTKLVKEKIGWITIPVSCDKRKLLGVWRADLAAPQVLITIPSALRRRGISNSSIPKLLGRIPLAGI